MAHTTCGFLWNFKITPVRCDLLTLTSDRLTSNNDILHFDVLVFSC